MSNEVTTFYRRQAELIAYLLRAKELTLAQDAEQMLQKNLPLAAASYFEHKVCELLRDFVKRRTNACEELICFFEQKAITRQYHALFDWDRSNANKFFSHFGDDFKSRVSAQVTASQELSQAAKDFLEIGSIRNNIVHRNYASFVAAKSSEEIFGLFTSAQRFIAFLEEQLAA